MSTTQQSSFKLNNIDKSNFLCNAICSKEDQAIEKKRTFYNRIILVFFIFACIILIVSVGIYVGQTNDKYTKTSSIIGLAIGSVGILIFIGLFVYNTKRDSIYREFYSNVNDIENVRKLKDAIIKDIKTLKTTKSNLNKINRKISMLNRAPLLFPVAKRSEYDKYKKERETEIKNLNERLNYNKNNLNKSKSVNKLYNDIKNIKNSMVNDLNELEDKMSDDKMPKDLYEKINEDCNKIKNQINTIESVDNILIDVEKSTFKRNLDSVNSICEVITLLKDYIYTKDKKETILNSDNILAFYVRKERFKVLKNKIVEINERQNLQVNFLTIINNINSTIDSFNDFIIEELNKINQEILNIQDPKTIADNPDKVIRQQKIRKIAEEVAIQRNNILEFLKIPEYYEINDKYNTLNTLIQEKKRKNGEIDTVTSAINIASDNISILGNTLSDKFASVFQKSEISEPVTKLKTEEINEPVMKLKKEEPSIFEKATSWKLFK